MPKVGPWLGCRMTVTTFLPRCAPSACKRFLDESADDERTCYIAACGAAILQALPGSHVQAYLEGMNPELPHFPYLQPLACP